MSSEPAGPAVPGPGSKLALGVLVGLAILSPWPFGSVDPWATRTIAITALSAALVAMAWDLQRGSLRLARGPALAWIGLWFLAIVQLVPLPASLHAWLAPGSAAVWHPDVAQAAAVLGPGPFPISLHPEATRRWLAFATGLVALAFAAAPALRERRLLVRASVAVVAGALAVALYGLVARLAFGDRLYGIWRVPTVAPFGPFVSKNHFAGYVELAALLAVGLAVGLAEEARRDRGWLSWIESRRARWIVLAWGVAFVLGLSVLVSLSRGGVVSLAAGLVAFVLVRFWTLGPARLSPRGFMGVSALLLFGSLVVVSLLPPEARARIASLVAVTSEASGSYRLTVWRDTNRLIASSPLLGSGFGAYEDALRRFRTASGEVAVEHAESDVREAVAEGGALGALLIGGLAMAVLLPGLRCAHLEPQRLTRALTTGALAGGVALAVHSLFDFNLHLPSNALLFAVLAAVLVAPAAGVAPPRALCVLSIVVIFASLALSLATSRRPAHLEGGSLLRAAPAPATGLRRAALDGDLLEQLHRRPTDAPSWLALAWVRQAATGEPAGPLARWSVRLDPTSRGVREAASRLTELTEAPQH